MIDRITIDQLNRTESKIDMVLQNQSAGIEDILIGFYEEEILNKEGKLNHLKDDKKVKGFFERLYREESEEIIDEKKEKSFSNKPFQE